MQGQSDPEKLCNDPEPVKIEVPEWPPPHFSTKMRELCEKYSDVLVEELRAGEKMYCPAMDVRLKEGYKGYICKKPRATPIHWRKYVDKEIKKLLREGIIERAHGHQPIGCPKIKMKQDLDLSQTCATSMRLCCQTPLSSPHQRGLCLWSNRTVLGSWWLIC